MRFISIYSDEWKKQLFKRWDTLIKILVANMKITVDKQLNQISYLERNFEMFLIKQYINIILIFKILKF